MNGKPFFSVIIPTLNEEKLLPKLLKDLFDQKEKSFEVLIVDGNSDDRTRNVALKFQTAFFLRIFKNERKNVAYQRNFGAQKSNGVYLIFLDADVRINASFIFNLKKYIDSKKGLVFIPYIKPENSSPEIKATYRLMNFLIEFSQNLDKPFSSSGSMIWEKNFFNLVGGFDENIFIGEDHSIIVKAQKWGVKAKFLKNIRLTYSLRRIKKEGRMKSLYKLLVGTLYNVLKGDVKKKIFEYEMGGQAYKKEEVKENLLRDKMNQIKSIFTT